MKDDLLLEDTSFEVMPEFADELAAMAGETGVVATPPSINRNSPAYIRWVQESLNRILGLRLATDGRMGSQTRSAIRSFQQKNSLAADGVVGVATEAALLRAVATRPSGTVITIPPGEEIKSAAARLQRFDFDKSDLKPQHRSEIAQVAARIAESWRVGRPFFTVYVVGHTDSEGRYQHNMALGLRRALAARRELTEALKRLGGNLAYKALILAQSKGSSELIDRSGTPEGQALNRRVEIFLSTKALIAFPKPPKPKDTPQNPQPIYKGGRIVRHRRLGCDSSLYETLQITCRNSAIGRIVACAKKFGVDESQAIGIAVTTIGTAATLGKAPPLAYVVGVIGGLAAACLNITAQYDLAKCAIAAIGDYYLCLDNARAKSKCV